LTQENLSKVFEDAVKVVLFPSDQEHPEPTVSNNTTSKKENSKHEKNH